MESKKVSAEQYPTAFEQAWLTRVADLVAEFSGLGGQFVSFAVGEPRGKLRLSPDDVTILWRKTDVGRYLFRYCGAECPRTFHPDACSPEDAAGVLVGVFGLRDVADHYRQERKEEEE